MTKPIPGGAGCGGGCALDGLALDPHRSALAPLEARHGAQKFALTLAFDPGDADDLAGVGGKIDPREAGPGKIVHLELEFAPASHLAGEHLIEGSPRDQG